MTSFRDQLAAVAADVQAILTSPDLVAGLPEFLAMGVRAYPERGGKALRPALTHWTCGLFGGNPASVRRIAAAIELFHTWTLVHDDIIDQDHTRRGQPSVHTLVDRWSCEHRKPIAPDEARHFGASMAILAGDIQQAWSSALVLDSVKDGVSPEVAIAIVQRLHTVVTPGLIAGEAWDVEFELRPPDAVSADEIMRMMAAKTGLLLRFAAEAGAMAAMNCADSANPTIHALADAVADAGLAFQLHDDLLGMFADEADLGKPIGSDLRQGKRTLLFARALEQNQSLLDYIGRDVSDAEFAEVCCELRNCGAVAAIEAEAADLLARAESALDDMPDNTYRDLLREWIRFVAARRY
jgi:geranylgeranyl diphosphate synthase type I